MSDSKQHAGFSFQISDTPPPARTSEGAPLGDLDLDMRDFGDAGEPSPLLPSAEPPSVKPPSAWTEPAVHPRPEIAQRPTPAALSDMPAALSNMPAALSDMPAALSASPAALNAVAPQPDSLRSPSAAATSAAATTTSPDAAAKPALPQSAREKAALDPTLTPRIKKIRFPARRGSSVGPEASSSAPRPARATKFSKSIGAKEPRRNLDSDPELSAAPQSQKTPAEMVPPEDLPGEDFNKAPTDDSNWGTDTPTAREIWKRARESWHVTSRKAVVLGGQSMRASKAFADSMNDKVRQRLREAAEERRALKDASGDADPSLPKSGDSSGSRSAGPSVAGRVILSLARSTGRKLAAPLSAAAAAGIVYFAGSHFLGTDATLALSKAVQAPEVPDLGTVKSADEGTEPQDEQGALAPSKEPAQKKGTAQGPPPMQTETTEMPEGMSWPGKGLIEVVTSTDELVYVDGVFTGRGPLRRIPVSPGEHAISIRAEGSERTGTVQVQANRNTRAVFKSD